MAALVRLLAPLGIAAPAVRTAVSRMVRQGWLEPTRLDAGPGYALTAKAVRRLDEAAGRVYRTAKQSWAGTFDLIVLDPPARRPARTRLTASLGFLGYGRLDDRVWISPRAHDEVAAHLTEVGVRYDRFTATHDHPDGDTAALVRRAWDLPALAQAYERFIADLNPVVSGVSARGDDEAAYSARFRLVHAWRAFLFHDPQLPPVLLPTPWAGTTAAAFFDRHAARLRPAADRFVNQCLEA